jgi:hypothetical protein
VAGECARVPLEGFARGLDIAAEVVAERFDKTSSEQLAATLTGAAAFVRSRGAFV